MDSVSLKITTNPITSQTEKIDVRLTNKSTTDIHHYNDFVIQYLDSGKWIDYPVKLIRVDLLNILYRNDSVESAAYFFPNETPIKTGKYRISTQYKKSNEADNQFQTLMCEFDIEQ